MCTFFTLKVEQVKFTKTQSSEAAQTMSVELENIKKIFSKNQAFDVSL